MPKRSVLATVLIWGGWSLGGILVGGLGGAIAGVLITEVFLADAGEDFLWAVYGLMFGPIIGLASGLLCASRIHGRGAREA